MIDQVRRFNRTVTQRVGALEDEFLSRDRPLSQARLLWEIGTEGGDVRLLRSRLDLDSGHLSRLLRALEHDHLVTVAPSSADGRVRTAHLTDLGQTEVAELDRRSDEVADSILAPLSEQQRTRLVTAMSEVERLLVASMVVIKVTDPRQPEARSCLRAYFSELARRFDDGFDQGKVIQVSEADMTPPACSWSLPCTMSRSAAARSGSGQATRPRSSGCGWPSRRAGSALAAGCSPTWSNGH